jgi:hypothetical protein
MNDLQTGIALLQPAPQFPPLLAVHLLHVDAFKRVKVDRFLFAMTYSSCPFSIGPRLGSACPKTHTHQRGRAGPFARTPHVTNRSLACAEVILMNGHSGTKYCSTIACRLGLHSVESTSHRQRKFLTLISGPKPYEATHKELPKIPKPNLADGVCEISWQTPAPGSLRMFRAPSGRNQADVPLALDQWIYMDEHFDVLGERGKGLEVAGGLGDVCT